MRILYNLVCLFLFQGLEIIEVRKLSSQKNRNCFQENIFCINTLFLANRTNEHPIIILMLDLNKKSDLILLKGYRHFKRFKPTFNSKWSLLERLECIRYPECS